LDVCDLENREWFNYCSRRSYNTFFFSFEFKTIAFVVPELKKLLLRWMDSKYSKYLELKHFPLLVELNLNLEEVQRKPMEWKVQHLSKKKEDSLLE